MAAACGLAVLLAACGDRQAGPSPDASAVELEVTFGAEIRGTHTTYSTFTVELRCDPPDGTVIDARASCERLEAEQELLVAPPGSACDRPPSDWEVTVRGTYEGRAVAAVFDRCHRAEVARWMRIVDFDIPEPGI